MNAIQFIQQHGVKRAKECLPAYEKHYCGLEQLFVEDLKRLVESVDIITKVGGINEAIEEHTKWMHAPELHLYRIGESVERLKQAIADYEAIGGEHV